MPKSNDTMKSFPNDNLTYKLCNQINYTFYEWLNDAKKKLCFVILLQMFNCVIYDDEVFQRANLNHNESAF